MRGLRAIWPGVRPAWAALAGAAVLVGATTPCHAQATPSPTPAPSAPASSGGDGVTASNQGDVSLEPFDATYRSGFQVGFSLGLGPGASNGYPADARKIGRAQHYTESGTGLGSYGALWVGGALADGFAFGVGAGAGSIQSGDLTSAEWNILFRSDIYPLFSLGEMYRDLGLQLEAGTAFATTKNADDDTLVDGNGAAYVGGGVFWEGLSLWRVRGGPFVGVHYLFSETMRRPLALAGFRTVLTTGP